MACGSCNGGSNGERWQVVYADKTVGPAQSKAQATAASAAAPGSYIRQVVSAR